jgi:hypothetical protein
MLNSAPSVLAKHTEIPGTLWTDVLSGVRTLYTRRMLIQMCQHLTIAQYTEQQQQ